jgi:ATP-binding cassette subfamily F protein 3
VLLDFLAVWARGGAGAAPPRELAARPPDGAEGEQGRLLREYARLEREHEASGAYDHERRVRAVLTSLGLPESSWDRPLGSFSGGERNVIGLARALLAEPDVMLLDEPSNHLDMEGVEWFAEFARSTPSAVVMVSHNRHLLDETAREIWEVGGGKVTPYAGNYSQYRRLEAEARALQERRYEVQRRLVERIEFQARRLTDMANAYDDPGQARRAKSMLKRLDRLDKVERPREDARRFGAALSGAARHGRIALSVKGFSYAHGDRALFDAADLEIEYGERVCLVGPNGCGKTTFLREVLAHGGWENPVLRLGKAVRVGEYRQLHDALDPERSLWDWTQEATGLLRTEAGELLHRFLFTREDLDRPVGTLSGGEKSRLQLARLAAAKVNFLLLDEPTNHLDIQACEQLEEMLEEFEGTLLVVSHDRFFLDRLVNRVVEVRDRKFVSFALDFPAWWRERTADRGRRRRGALEASRRGPKEDAEDSTAAARARAREEKRLRQRLRGVEDELQRLEARHADLGARLEAACADPRERGKVETLAAEYADVRGRIDALYADYERLAAELEPPA